MRLAVVIGSFVALSGIMAAACSSSPSADSGPGATQDAGKQKVPPANGSSGGEETDGGADAAPQESSPFKVTALKEGAAAFVGLLSDGLVVYQTFANDKATLEAIPIDGGTATVIADNLTDKDLVGLAGGAVAWYTDVDADGLTGTLNLWTKANGAKLAVAKNASTDVFTATADGARVAFSVGAVVKDKAVTATALAVTNSAAPDAKAVITDANSVAFTKDCTPRYRFVGSSLITAHCTEDTGPNATAARLLVVDANGNVRRLDAAAKADNTLAPLWIANNTGAKVLAIGPAPDREARVFTVDTAPAAGGVSTVDKDVLTGFWLDDGRVVYETSTALKKATPSATGGAATVTPLVASGVKALKAISNDGSHVLFRTLDPAGSAKLTDLNSADTTTANQTPVALVPTATTLGGKFTASGTSVLYLTDIGAKGASLKVQPVGGGPEKVLATTALGTFTPDSGNGVLIITGVDKQQSGDLYTLHYVDAATGGDPVLIADSIPAGAYDFVGTKFVYTRITEQGSGVYAIDLSQGSGGANFAPSSNGGNMHERSFAAPDKRVAKRIVHLGSQN